MVTMQAVKEAINYTTAIDFINCLSSKSPNQVHQKPNYQRQLGSLTY
jgi:hypothetical protein